MIGTWNARAKFSHSQWLEEKFPFLVDCNKAWNRESSKFEELSSSRNASSGYIHFYDKRKLDSPNECYNVNDCII
jgi:hypothetical protein